jgi:cytochrome c oxidase subunit 3/cytochrome o ubiquinol oxidase subunit 3
MSSLTMVLALSAVQRGDNRGLRIWIAATALLGGIFVGGQFFEFTTFAHEGLTLDSNIFGSSFYVLTGFHGAHVTIGIVWLLSLLVVSLRGGIPAEKSADVEIAGLYWHFVDIVWIVIFTLVYLIPYADGPEGAAEAVPHAFLRVLTLGERLLAALPF